MKVRIGVGVGGGPTEEVASFAQLIDVLDELRFDSIWLPEVLTAPTLDPLAGLAFAAAHNHHLKLGTTMLLPGRNLVRMAKQLASLDVLSAGRLLVTMVPGLARQPEQGAVGVLGTTRGALMDEMFPVLRALWAGETVAHDGPAGTFEGVSISPLPLQQPLEMWTGGMVPAALRRCGRFADGWLPSSCTPEELVEGRRVIEDAAAEAGRAIDPEHFGVSLAYSRHPLDDRTLKAISATRKGVDPAKVVPIGMGGLRAMLEEFIDIGFSKFVVRPMGSPTSWRTELEELAEGILDLQT